LSLFGGFSKNIKSIKNKAPIKLAFALTDKSNGTKKKYYLNN
jgi:hypothetical protein